MDCGTSEKLRECCKNKKSYLIIYDGAGTADLPVLVCQDHWDNDPIFHKFVKSNEKL